MSLERAMTRLSLRPASISRQCRRTFTSPAKPRQQQSAVGAIAETLQSTRTATSSPQPQHQMPAAAPAVAPLPAQDAFGFANKAVASIAESNNRAKIEEQARTLARGADRKGLESQQIRRWQVGDVYAPHDLSGAEQSKWKRLKQKARPRWDVLDQLNIKPMDHYKNFSIMSEYVTEMGKIKHNKDTGLRPRNQRKMAKAVRRAIGLGLIPSVYRHPQVLMTEPDYRRRMSRTGQF